MGNRRIGRKRLKALSSRGVTDTITAGVGAPSVTRQTIRREGNKIITEISVDLGGNTTVAEANGTDIIGGEGLSTCSIATLSLATHGYITYAEIACVEAPTVASADIDLHLGSSATDTEGGAVTDANVLVEANGSHSVGSRVGAIITLHDWDSESDKFLYLVNGASANAGTYGAGKLLITLEGIASDAVPSA
jgi:hypothetical protein